MNCSKCQTETATLKGFCCKCYHNNRYESQREDYNKRNRDKRKEVKKRVVEKLGGECKCCGIKDIEFLTVDHIEGNGNIHRRNLGSSHLLYKNIVDDNYDVTQFQLLCWNCNSSLGMYGYCPHNPEMRRETKAGKRSKCTIKDSKVKIGEKSGNFVALSEAYSRGDKRVVTVECSCGRVKETREIDFLNNDIKCYCRRYEADV